MADVAARAPTSATLAPGQRLRHDRSGEQQVMEPVRPAQGRAGREASDASDGHEAGEEPHAVQVRFLARRGVELGKAVTGDDGPLKRTREPAVAPAHPTDERDPADRRSPVSRPTALGVDIGRSCEELPP